MTDAPPGLGDTQVAPEWVLVRFPHPVDVGASVDDLMQAFRAVLSMGNVQRVEMKYGQAYLEVDRYVQSDQIKPGMVRIDGAEPSPADEEFEFLTEQRAEMDLYGMVRTGAVGLEDIDKRPDAPDLLLAAIKSLNEKNLVGTHVLAGHEEAFRSWMSGIEGADSLLSGVTFEVDPNIPEDAFLLFGGPDKGCDKLDLQHAVRVSFTSPLEEFLYAKPVDASDDQEGPGAPGGRPGDGEAGDPEPGRRPPSFLRGP